MGRPRHRRRSGRQPAGAPPAAPAQRWRRLIAPSQVQVPRGWRPAASATPRAPGDVRVEDRPDPEILRPTDAVIRLSATCICGSDLWPYRGIEAVDGPVPMGHEYVGIVEEVGSAVATIEPGQFVIGSFFASDNTCEICRAGYQSSCVHREPMGAIGTQAELARVPLADGTLVATPDVPPDDLIPSFLAASDVLGTGWFGAIAAAVAPGETVAVVGDGAVGLLAVLASRQFGAERIIVMSRHEQRQKLALELGATDIIEERGDDGAARIKDLTGGLGAHSVIERERDEDQETTFYAINGHQQPSTTSEREANRRIERLNRRDGQRVAHRKVDGCV